MQCRRRWSAVAGIVLLGIGARLAEARDPAADAAAMQAAHGQDAVTLRNTLLDDLNKLPVIKKNDYVASMVGGSAVNGPWAKLLEQTDNPDAQLNAAILIAQAKTLSADSALEQLMVPNANPAIRYWGAKGLENILPDLIKVGGAVLDRAIKSLTATIAKEKSGVVKEEIIKALGVAGDVPALQMAADALSDQLQAGPADHETLDAAAAAMTQLDGLLKKGAAVNKEKVAKSAAWIAGLSAQQLQTMVARDKANGGSGDAPPAFTASVIDAVTGAFNVLNDLAGKAAFTPPAKSASPDEIQFAVDGVTGTASAAGSLQKIIPNVPVPPAIKK